MAGMADNDLILRAAAFAAEAHKNQKRKYAPIPYIVHPARVAAAVSKYQLATYGMVAAAWLHDVVEDCGVSLATLDHDFGPVVAKLVEELTNVSKKIQPPLRRAERMRLDRERIKGISLEAKIIKLADRTDNLMDLATVPNEMEYKGLYVQESLNLYVHALADTSDLFEESFLAATNSVLFNPTNPLIQ